MVLLMSACALEPLEAGDRRQSHRDGFVRPARRAAPPAPTAPSLPSTLEIVPDYTLTVTLEAEGDPRTATRRARVVSRATDRVHVAEGRDVEWLFRRNALDRARVSGVLVDHREQRLVVYDESDLRNLLGIGGWADVVSLGFDHGLLSRGTATAHERYVGIVRFVEYHTPAASFWWSPEAGLATGFEQQQGVRSQRVSIEAASPGVDPALLQDPSARFPAYEAMDVAEWLELPTRRPRP
jgi:hypothetical protein